MIGKNAWDHDAQKAKIPRPKPGDRSFALHVLLLPLLVHLRGENAEHVIGETVDDRVRWPAAAHFRAAGSRACPSPGSRPPRDVSVTVLTRRTVHLGVKTDGFLGDR